MTELDRKTKIPYTQSWNFTVAGQFLPGWTVETGYSGSHSINLLAEQSINNALLVNTAIDGGDEFLGQPEFGA